TLFGTAFWLPVFVLARYLMKDADGGGYFFYQKVPLGRFGWTWNGIAVGIILALILSQADWQPPSSTSGSPRPVPVSNPITTSPPQLDSPRAGGQTPTRMPQEPTQEREAFRRKIEQRRAALESADRTFERERRWIESERSDLNALQGRLE